MKIALCYYGNAGWYFKPDRTKASLPPRICFENVRKHIIEPNGEVDIFVHSWSKEFEEEILEIFQPSSALIENQHVFTPDLASHHHIHSLADLKSNLAGWLKNKINSNYKVIKLEALRHAYSRWYSTQQVIRLKEEHEKKYEIRYDFVMLLRFDIVFYTDIIFHKYDPNCFYLADPSDLDRLRHNYLVLKNKKGYQPKDRSVQLKPLIHQFREKFNLPKTPFWVQPSWKNALLIKLRMNHYNLSDTWFFGGSDVMNQFGSLYNSIQNYNPSPHVASYEHITKILPKENLRFPFEQFTDFELYRFSKTCGVQHPNNF